MPYAIGFLVVINLATLIHQLKTARRIMASFSEVLQKIDEATNAAAARVTTLIEGIKESGAQLTAEQQAEADAIVSHLGSIGASTTASVPDGTTTASSEPAASTE